MKNIKVWYNVDKDENYRQIHCFIQKRSISYIEIGLFYFVEKKLNLRRSKKR